MVEALLDPKSLLLCLIQLSCNIPNGGISNVSVIPRQNHPFPLTMLFSSSVQSWSKVLDSPSSTPFWCR